MKQILLTVAVVTLGITTAGAQRLKNVMNLPVQQKMEMPSKLQKVNKARVLKQSNQELAVFTTNKLALNKAPRRADETDPQLIAWYSVPSGSFFWGLDPEWGAYPDPRLQTPAFVPQTFYNTTYASDKDTEVTYKWTIETSSEVEMEQDEEGNATHSLWGAAYAPKLVATQGDLTDEHILQSSDGKSNGIWFAGTDSIESLSHSSYAHGMYGGFSNREETFTTGTVFKDGLKVTGFAEMYEGCTDVVYATSLYILGWLDGTENLTTPLGENELKAEIFLLDEDGNLSKEPYAVAYATNDNIVVDENYGSTTIMFPFLEEDDLFGTVETGVVLPQQDYAIIFSGFENMEGTFQVPFSSATDGGYYLVDGHSYVLLEDGSFATIGYQAYPDIPQINLYIGIQAAIPVIQKYDEEVEIEFPTTPEEGEEVVYGITGYDPDEDEYEYFVFIQTGTPFDEENGSWMVSGPDWLAGYEVDDALFEKYNILTFYFTAQPLPEELEGRSGEIVLTCYGKEVTIPVKQGNVESGIANVTRDLKHQGKTFNLSGQLVGEDYKGLVIKNGKKLILK